MLAVCGAWAAPRPLLPPWPEFGRMYHEGFDQPLRFSTNQTVDPATWAESFSGYALQRSGKSVTPWRVPMVVSNSLQVEPEHGAFRFWYQPAAASGSGPGQVATLLELSTSNGKASEVWWALVVSPKGDEVHLVCQTENGLATCLNGAVNWEAGSWHMLTLGFTPTNSALFIDDQLAAVGEGLVTIPKEAAPFTSLTVGSSVAGSFPAQGQMEDLGVFSGRKKIQRIMGNVFGLSADWEITAYFASLSKVAALGPISEEEIAARKELAAKRKAEREALALTEESGGAMMFRVAGAAAGCVTNGPMYLTNLVCSFTTNVGWQICFDIVGGENDPMPYDIFSTPALLGNDVTNSVWTWLETGNSCETHCFTNQATNQMFYLLTIPGADRDGDGMYDGWEWKHFGSLAQTAAGDFDGSGENNGDAYTNNHDPNQIQFALDFGTRFVNGNTAAGQVLVAQGVPEQMAVRVNDTNFAAAVWQPYQSNVLASIGNTDGEYVVWVGLAGHAPDTTRIWHGVTITRDTVAPILVVTNPASGVVGQPLAQVQGYANEQLAWVRYDLTNGIGLQTNLAGYAQQQWLDTNTLRFTTNWFQCYDVALETNLNTFTLRVADLAGNVTTTNLNLTLDYSGDTNAPVIAVTWPEDNALVAGTNFMLRGQVNEAVVSVVVAVESASYAASVDRNGQFEVSGLPLTAPTNYVAVIATDAAGNVRTNTRTVRQSSETLTINPIVPTALTQPTVTVSGTVGVSGQSVWVNGLAATVTGNSWTVDVPTPAGGMANFDVQTGSAWESPTAQQTLALESPPQVRAVRFEERYEIGFVATGGGEAIRIRERFWELGLGGYSAQHFTAPYVPLDCATHIDWPPTWPAGEIFAGDTTCPEPAQDYETSLSAWQNADWHWGQSYNYENETTLETGVRGDHAQRRAHTQIQLLVGGQTGSAPRLIRLTAQAAALGPEAWSSAVSLWGGDDTIGENGWGSITQAPSAIRIFGQSLTPTVTNANVGELFVTLPANSTNDLPFSVVGADNYSFDVKAEEVKLELTWTNVVGNLPIEDNNNPLTGLPMLGGGKRIFVGALNPTETNLRNTVMLQAKLTPPIPNARFYFRAFDVDDPSADNDLDTNGGSGDDNNGPDFTTALFLATGSRYAQADADSNGLASVEFRVGAQPGNNYRVAVTLALGDLAGLSVVNPSSPYYVPANDTQMTTLPGKLSPMLTVWRKLHLEVDSMEAVATNGTEANFETGVVSASQADNPVTGQTRIATLSTLRGYGEHNVYENGRLEIAGEGTFQILSNQFFIDVNDTPFYYFYVEGAPGTNIVGQTFTLYDDDDRFLSTIGLPPALPKDDESTNIVQGIRSVFFPAYIDVTNANAMGLNPAKQIVFKRNEPAVHIGIGFPSVFDDAKNLNDSSYFWAHTLVFGYQPEVSEDGEPDSESGGEPTRGGTPKSNFISGNHSQGYSVVFIEAVRDRTFRDFNDGTFSNPTTHAGYANLLLKEMYGTIAHEIGHSPGAQWEPTDHAEDGLMITGAAAIDVTDFKPPTIKRFRNALRWKE